MRGGETREEGRKEVKRRGDGDDVSGKRGGGGKQTASSSSDCHNDGLKWGFQI